MIQKEIDVSIPFDTIKKTYPDGTVSVKKLKFTCYRIEKGYEELKPEERVVTNEREYKRKETYADVVGDWKDKRAKSIASGIEWDVDNNAPISLYDDRITPLEISYEKEVDEEKNRKKILYNIAITRNKIFDIARSNDFTHFITLTYNSDVCDRYSFSECSSKARKFMNNFRSRNKETCPDFRYLLVHEQHKDGAYHYHGLIYLEDTSTLKLADKQPKSCKYPVYNWDKWHHGFSTATEIQDQEACRSYILKYISKEIAEDYQKGQRHFYYSQNCEKPIKESMVSDAQMWILYDQIYDTDKSTGYEVTKRELHDRERMVVDHQYGIDIGDYEEVVI